LPWRIGKHTKRQRKPKRNFKGKGRRNGKKVYAKFYQVETRGEKKIPEKVMEGGGGQKLIGKI